MLHWFLITLICFGMNGSGFINDSAAAVKLTVVFQLCCSQSVFITYHVFDINKTPHELTGQFKTNNQCLRWTKAFWFDYPCVALLWKLSQRGPGKSAEACKTSPEEAFAAFARQGVEVVTLGQVAAHPAQPGLVVPRLLPLFVVVLILYRLRVDPFSERLCPSCLLTHCQLQLDSDKTVFRLLQFKNHTCFSCLLVFEEMRSSFPIIFTVARRCKTAQHQTRKKD